MRSIEDGVAAKTQTVANNHAAFADSFANTLGATDDTTGSSTVGDVAAVADGSANGCDDHGACDDTRCRRLTYGNFVGIGAAVGNSGDVADGNAGATQLARYSSSLSWLAAGGWRGGG